MITEVSPIRKTIRCIKSALLLMLSALLLSSAAFAAPTSDASRTVSLTIYYDSDGTPISGAPFDLYLVAEGSGFGVTLCILNNCSKFCFV